LRKLSRQTAREYLDEELDSKQFAGNNMESKESELCLIFDLQTMLKRIPKKQREAFTLMKVQGLSVREAADLSGMSESAVKVSVHRARKSLQKLLER
jgi:RNA polymerase sigma-70 factor (ECF subfamily)